MTPAFPSLLAPCAGLLAAIPAARGNGVRRTDTARLDLLSGLNCCDAGGFHLFRRKTDGSWAPRQQLKVTPAEKVRILGGSFVSAADWNGDGSPDLLCVATGRGIAVGLGPFKEGEPITISREIALTLKEWGALP